MLEKGSHISSYDIRHLIELVVEFTELTVFTLPLAIKVTDAKVGPEVIGQHSHAELWLCGAEEEVKAPSGPPKPSCGDTGVQPSLVRDHHIPGIQHSAAHPQLVCAAGSQHPQSRASDTETLHKSRACRLRFAVCWRKKELRIG